MVEKIYLLKLGQNIFIKKINIFQIVHSLNSLLLPSMEMVQTLLLSSCLQNLNLNICLFIPHQLLVVVILVAAVSTISLQIRVQFRFAMDQIRK